MSMWTDIDLYQLLEELSQDELMRLRSKIDRQLARRREAELDRLIDRIL